MSMGKPATALALLLALMAMAAGDFERLDETIARRPTTVIDVAQAIRDQAPMLLVDLQMGHNSDPDSLALPTAVSLEQAMAASSERFQDIVVYGFEDNRDWVALRAHGKPIFFLENGVDAWVSKVLNPTIHESAGTDALRQFEANAPLARYFGGTPRYLSSPAPDESTHDQLTKLRRRGCGF